MDEMYLLEELTEEFAEFKRQSRYGKLLETVSLSISQYESILEQRYRTSDTRKFASTTAIAGEHFVLMSLLESVLGIRVASSDEALDLADEVIDKCYPQN